MNKVFLIVILTLITSCSIPERRRVIERIIRQEQTSHTPRHIRYEQCVARMVQLDIFKPADIETLCNQAHGRRE